MTQFRRYLNTDQNKALNIETIAKAIHIKTDKWQTCLVGLGETENL